MILMGHGKFMSQLRTSPLAVKDHVLRHFRVNINIKYQIHIIKSGESLRFTSRFTEPAQGFVPGALAFLKLSDVARRFVEILKPQTQAMCGINR